MVVPREQITAEWQRCLYRRVYIEFWFTEKRCCHSKWFSKCCSNSTKI